jgi:hypothetical protein
MTHKMMALRDFRGRDGEGTTLSKDRRFVEAGAEFTPTDEKRANWLETMGLAIPVTKQTEPITSRSMKATASPRGQKRSTPATVRGGGKKAGSPRSKG